ncbi:MAG: GNAT family N-acetyltransferase [Myxococcota bacterium]|nr:GNAT family N-acetyltransferase [Myxococcota bacterium]
MSQKTAPELPELKDPKPRWTHVDLGNGVSAADDAYSDRVRCKHPDSQVDGAWLGQALVDSASSSGRGRSIVFCRQPQVPGLVSQGFGVEACLPSFYKNGRPCFALSRPTEGSAGKSQPGRQARKVDRLLAKAHKRPSRWRQPVVTRKARVTEAGRIAALMGEVFEAYPTPIAAPSYIQDLMHHGTLFRVVEDKEGELVACASAEPVAGAPVAEISDCATATSQRGKGLQQALIKDLMADLQAKGYRSCYSLARARVPGMNLSLARQGFTRRGRMHRYCRIGTGLEDMNVWSRALA